MGSDGNANSLGQHVKVATKSNGQEGVCPQERDTSRTQTMSLALLGRQEAPTQTLPTVVTLQLTALSPEARAPLIQYLEARREQLYSCSAIQRVLGVRQSNKKWQHTQYGCALKLKGAIGVWFGYTCFQIVAIRGSGYALLTGIIGLNVDFL
ncbi:hypothetical protein DFH08DRAFT_798357 [Mycena albidolilacea]|uniref:Uncharacterized protein n=1 Tax=Mycena albidolilacea TaxID=1033008 RepID=A0AAD7F3C4_9AGAR|nr:hypothetical protein DFH08DRAFT_798357 [Mycena albidolilacea]